MKNGWENPAIGDVCKVIGGGTPAKNRPEFYRGDIPWATIRDMRGDWLRETECSITNAAISSSATHLIPAGSVLVATRVGLGKVSRISQDTAINQDIRAIIPQDLNQLDRQYLFYWFKSIAELIKSEGKGATVKGVTLPFIKSLRIPLPGLKEQQRVVAILDEAFAGIATARANAANSRKKISDLSDGHLRSLFLKFSNSRAKIRLGELCTFVRGPFGGSLKKSIFVADGFAVYEQQHAIYDQFDDVRYFVDEKKFHEMARFEIAPNDLIMSCSGTMGRVAIVPAGIRRGIINQALLKLTPSPLILGSFLKLWMESESFQDALKAYSGGAAIQNVASVKILKEIAVPLPSLEEQMQIVASAGSFGEEIQRLESIYTRKLTALDELKQSLLHQAFSGQL